VGLSFQESGPRGMVLAEIGGEATTVRFIPIETREMAQEVLDLKEIISQDEVIEAVVKLAGQRAWRDDFVRLILRGELFPEVDLNLDEVRERAGSGIHFLSLVDETTSFYDLAKLSKDRSIVGEFVRLMTARLEEAAHDPARKAILKKALTYGLDAFYLPRVCLR